MLYSRFENLDFRWTESKSEENKMIDLAMKESLVDVAVDIVKTKGEKKPLEETPAVDVTWQDLIDFGTCTEYYPANAPPHFASHASPLDKVPMPDLTANYTSSYYQNNSNYGTAPYNTPNAVPSYHNSNSHISQFDANHNVSYDTNYHPYSFASAPYNNDMSKR